MAVPETDIAGSVAEDAGKAGAAEQLSSDETEQSAAARPVPQTPSRKELEISPAERRFMLELGAAVGRSPRRLKRFVNAYRILKAANTPLDEKVFIVEGGRSGVYRAVLTLLAVTTGAPSLANLVLNRLSDARETQDLEQFRKEIRTIVGDSVWTEELRCLEAAFDCYQRAKAQEAEPVSVEELHNWAADVARFTFRAGAI
jgi:hypothetical protein